MNHVQDNLYIGSYYDSQDSEQIRQQQIKVIVSVAYECDDMPFPNGTIKKQINIRSKCAEDITRENLDEFCKIVDIALKLKMNVLIHCVNGMHRSATFVIYYLMKKNFWNIDISYYFLKDRRAIIDPPYEFLETINSYQ